ncbi:hypothetical protein [Thiocapsa marina]|nr:hypothetical protein [Thiocapsa marina]
MVIKCLAAIALGESRLDGALDLVRARWNAEPVKRGAAAHLSLRAAALHRSEAALDWLVSFVGDADRASEHVAIAELGAYRNNARQRKRLRGVVAERGNPRLGAANAKAFPPPTPGT